MTTFLDELQNSQVVFVKVIWKLDYRKTYGIGICQGFIIARYSTKQIKISIQRNFSNLFVYFHFPNQNINRFFCILSCVQFLLDMNNDMLQGTHHMIVFIRQCK